MTPPPPRSTLFPYTTLFRSLTGDYFGLPWPCYGNAELKHPGTPNLYDTSKAMMEGGGCFRALFGMEKDGVNLLDRKSTRLNSSHSSISYAVFCLKKKKNYK